MRLASSLKIVTFDLFRGFYISFDWYSGMAEEKHTKIRKKIKRVANLVDFLSFLYTYIMIHRITHASMFCLKHKYEKL
jgi:NADH:ubiquinone oxidoreductase subunit 5 (subunit L)/multisubunit Na+/H+ antiporter MnhA subunit